MKNFRKSVLFFSLLCLTSMCGVYGMVGGPPPLTKEQQKNFANQAVGFLKDDLQEQLNKKNQVGYVLDVDVENEIARLQKAIKDKQMEIKKLDRAIKKEKLKADDDDLDLESLFDPAEFKDLENTLDKEEMDEKNPGHKKKCNFPTAVKTRRSKIIKDLVEQGKQNVDAVLDVDSGNTALHLAAKDGYLLGVKTLLELGADFKIKNKANLTPLQVVEKELKNKKIEYNKKKHFYWVSKLLEKAAAKK